MTNAPWTNAPRFDAGFWTEAPLVDRATYHAKHALTGAKKRIGPEAVGGRSIQADPAAPATGRAAGTLPVWSDVPRFDAEFWTKAPLVDREKVVEAKHMLVGGRRKLQGPTNNLGNAGQHNVDAPQTPRKLLNDSGIVRARLSNADHLMGIAEVNPKVAPPTPRRHVDNNSGIVRARRSNVDHLKGAASINLDLTPATPPRYRGGKTDTLAELPARVDHLVGIASINLEMVPEEMLRHGCFVQAPSHLFGVGAQVNPDVGMEQRLPRKKIQHPPSNLGGGCAVVAEDHIPGRSVLRDWRGQAVTGPVSTCVTPRAGSVVSTPRQVHQPDCASIRSLSSCASPRITCAETSDRVAPSGCVAASATSTPRISNMANLGTPRATVNAVQHQHRMFGIPGAPASHRGAAIRDRGPDIAGTIQEFFLQERMWGGSDSQSVPMPALFKTS